MSSCLTQKSHSESTIVDSYWFFPQTISSNSGRFATRSDQTFPIRPHSVLTMPCATTWWDAKFMEVTDRGIWLSDKS
jgi:hypothetical protein